MPNNNKKMVDLPFFELLNQAPVAASAVSGLTTAEDGTSKFVYYLSGSTFYRYDTEGDTWQQLATPNVAPVTAISMRYTKFRGYHGRTISATSSSITIPGLRGKVLSGSLLKILKGKGVGQEATITLTDETVHDFGVITGTTTSTLVDSTKKWRVNQWSGYLVGITFGTDATQYKKILYNDTNTLYIADANLQPHDSWNNQVFVAAAPYALPVTTAGAQAHYQIMSQTYSVSPSWTITPDDTSYFTTETGGIYLLSSAAAAPFFTLQYYDTAHDSWQTKTVPQGMILAALGTDFTTDRTGLLGSAYVTKVGTVSATIRSLTDNGLTLTYDRYANYRLYITGGTGVGQSRRIVAHTATTFTISNNWDITPDSSSTYEVWPDANRLYLAGGAAAAMYAYSIPNDYWMQGHHFDDGVVTNISATLTGWDSFGVSTGARIASGIRTVNSVPTAGGTGYLIGDVLTCSVGGAGAQVRVTSIAPGGVVTGIELIHSGTSTGYTVGTGRATTGGTGSGATIEITTVGATALITLATNHFLKTGDVVTFAGCNESAWNAAHTIIGVPGLTTFCVSVTATASMATVATQSTTTLYDPNKNWVVNEHAGRLVHLMTAGTAPTSQIRWIVSNTATTLTVATWTAAGNGTSKYIIYDSKVFGVDNQYKTTNKSNNGWATGGSTSTLVDSSKNWTPNQWAGYLFKIEAGTGYGSGRISIISNTETTLTYATQSFTPNATTKYEIADSWGLATAGGTTGITEATTKNWIVNQWAGKRVRFTGGTAAGQEATIASNTATAITTGTITATDATSTYAILGIPARSTGIELIWNWGSSDPATKGRHFYLPRGGNSNTFDIYDITTSKWTYGYFFSPQADLLNTGSSYAYDGADTIYMSRAATNVPIRIFAYDVIKNTVKGAATTTWLQGTIHIGNALEIVTTTDGYKYMYVLQDSGTLFSRALLF
jgi:hypothetical protein